MIINTTVSEKTVIVKYHINSTFPFEPQKLFVIVFNNEFSVFTVTSTG